LRAKFPPGVEGASLGPGGFALALQGGLISTPANNNYKMDIFQTYATDSTLEVEGRWAKISRDASVLVARTGNERFTRKVRDLMKKHSIDFSDESEETAKLVDELMIEAMAETILLGWKGMTKDGQPYPYSTQNAIEALRIKDFRKKISDLADAHSAYRAKADEEQGND
jgi:hypothetical protein